MPKKDGREVLAEIKSDSELKHIPVIIISSTDDIHDIQNCFITKPFCLTRFIEIVKSIVDFW